MPPRNIIPHTGPPTAPIKDKAIRKIHLLRVTHILIVSFGHRPFLDQLNYSISFRHLFDILAIFIKVKR